MDRLSVNGSKLKLRLNPAKEEGPVFLCRVPAWRDRYLLKNKVAHEGLHHPGDSVLIDRARAVIAEQRPENGDVMLADIQRVDETDVSTAEGRAARRELRQRVDRHLVALSRIDGELAGIMADRATYTEVCAGIAFQMFVESAEGEGAPEIKRRGGMVSEACMSALPSATIEIVGLQLLAKMLPSEDEAKNSEPPSPSA